MALFSKFAFNLENKLFVIAAIIAVPLFDMMRVIGVRLLHGKSPLKADRNHIHHVLLDLGLSHYKIALLLGVVNYLLAILIIFLARYLNSFQMMITTTLIFVVLVVIFYKLKTRLVYKVKFENGLKNTVN